VFIGLRVRHLLGACSGAESGEIQSGRTPAEYGLQQNPIPPHCIGKYSILVHTEKGRKGVRVEPERRLEWQQFTKLGRKYQHD